MFDPLPQKPPHLAGKWIVCIGTLGGCLGVAVAGVFLGVEGMQSDLVMLGSFGLGAIAGTFVGMRLVLPRGATTSDL